MARQFFVNVSVRDVKKSMAFFGVLGFTFNPRFSDDNAACMIVNDGGFVMLLAAPFFRTFTRREPCDTSSHTEALLAISCDSRTEVDAVVHRAVDSGGSYAMEPIDHGFMYGWSFYDLDGHHWEVLWMDPAAAQ